MRASIRTIVAEAFRRQARRERRRVARVFLAALEAKRAQAWRDMEELADQLGAENRIRSGLDRR